MDKNPRDTVGVCGGERVAKVVAVAFVTYRVPSPVRCAFLETPNFAFLPSVGKSPSKGTIPEGVMAYGYWHGINLVAGGRRE